MTHRGPAIALLLTAALGALGEEEPPTSCLACHDDPELFEEEGRQVVAGFLTGVHAAAGFSCHDCHGGNPDPRLGDDLAAMDPDFPGSPYIGVPARSDVPGLCGGCHSDPELMRRYQPEIRVDQELEFWTSQHGRRLAAGDQRVAICTDCHGVHGIRGVAHPESTVYPTRVAETCRGCHADRERMGASGVAGASDLPTDQYAGWRHSVHAEALLEKGDLSAPTCNDCHGNHGATPPGIDSIAFVCGQCHGREATLFRASAKRSGFAEHNDYVSDLEGEGCGACHEAPEPQAELDAITSLTECTSCHGNHAVARPTLAMLSPLPALPCAFCHEPSGELEAVVAELPEQQGHYEQVKAELLAEAGVLELDREALYDWLVERALTLPTHTLPGEPVGGEGAAARLRPEFERLFDKFRLGKVAVDNLDPATGEPVRHRVVRCSDCHAAEPLLADEPRGLETARDLLEQMRQVTALTARAERIVLAARRGGVETRDALLEIDGAVDAQIELEVLLHGFEAGEGSAFAAKRAEGVGHAVAALEAAERAIEELAFRRRGLFVTLAILLLILVLLGAKIRQLD